MRRTCSKAGEQIRVAQADAPFIAVISGEPYDANLVKEWATEHEVEAVTALTKLAEFGKVAEVRALLNVGVPVSGTAEAGATPLHYACFTGQTEVVKLLIQHGASLTIRDDTYKATPLGWALEAFGWHRRMDSTIVSWSASFSGQAPHRSMSNASWTTIAKTTRTSSRLSARYWPKATQSKGTERCRPLRPMNCRHLQQD